MTNDTMGIVRAHPLVAILRGVMPDQVLAVAELLLEAGFRVIEVPLNSPSALHSIALLARTMNVDVVVGAGTVLSVDDVRACAQAGARLILSPNLDPAVVRQAVALGLTCMPGVATPSEGFAALQAGAHALKLFPADVLGSATVKAWRAVFDPATAFYCVGGMAADNMAVFRRAGATGVGLGSSLYQPGIALDELARRAKAMQQAWIMG
jgi:2-dehydro-3-deoxyphosphogalactonate aldolase